MKKLDLYLNQIQQPISEGLWSKFLRAIEPQGSKHPKLRSMNKYYQRNMEKCYDLYPDFGGRAQLELGDWVLDWDNTQADPRRLQCETFATVKYLKEVLSWANKVGEKEVCKYNRNVKRCHKWFEEGLEDAKQELKLLKPQLDMMKKDKKPSRQKFARIKKVLS